MAKFKRKTKVRRVRCKDGDLYIFKNGVANVPGTYHKTWDGFTDYNNPYTVTWEEFQELNK